MLALDQKMNRTFNVKTTKSSSGMRTKNFMSRTNINFSGKVVATNMANKTKNEMVKQNDRYVPNKTQDSFFFNQNSSQVPENINYEKNLNNVFSKKDMKSFRQQFGLKPALLPDHVSFVLSMLILSNY